jgi:pimeloyl-ACP methyl ester carboxylesterase
LRPCRPLYRYLLFILGVPVALIAIVLVAFWTAAQWRETTARAAAAPASGHFVSGGDVEMFVQESGPADGPPVLLVHGTGAWGAIWRPTMDVLAQAGYRAIAVDLPPFGFSERPRDGPYDDAAQAARLLAVLEALEAHDVTLVGHSFGARPTVEAAMMEPGRVRLLVLVDAALSPSTSVAMAPQPALPIRAAVGTRWIREPLVAATLTNPWLTKRLLQQLIFDPADATDEQVRMVQAQFPVTGTTRALGSWLHFFLLGEANGMNQDPARYASLTMPTLLIWGEKDVITPPAMGQALLGLFPRADLVTLANAGHIPAIEDAASFHSSLLGFLSAHQPPQQ